jgi:hypothetical protein
LFWQWPCTFLQYWALFWSGMVRRAAKVLFDFGICFYCVCVSHGEFLQYYYYVYRSLSSFPSVLVDGASVLIYCSALRWERYLYSSSACMQGSSLFFLDPSSYLLYPWNCLYWVSAGSGF